MVEEWKPLLTMVAEIAGDSVPLAVKVAVTARAEHRAVEPARVEWKSG